MWKKEMAHQRIAGEDGAQDGVEVVGVFQNMEQGVAPRLVPYQEAYRLHKQEKDRKIQEAQRKAEETKRKDQKALSLQDQEVVRNFQEAQGLHKQENDSKTQGAQRKAEETKHKAEKALSLQEQEVVRNFQEAQGLHKQEKDRETQGAQREVEEEDRGVGEMERNFQAALRLHKQEKDRLLQEAQRKVEMKFRKIQYMKRQSQESLRQQQQETERNLQVMHQQEQETLREMEGKLRDKDLVICDLHQQLRETHGRVSAVNERTTASGESGTGGYSQCVEVRGVKDKSSTLTTQLFLPQVQTYCHVLSKPQGASAFFAAARALESRRREMLGRGAAAGGGEESPLLVALLAPSSTPTSSGTAHRGPSDEGDEHVKRRTLSRMREVQLRVEEVRNSPNCLGELLMRATKEGKLTDVGRLIDSGADVNYVDESGCTPLMKAVSLEAPFDLVALLLQRGADVNAVNCSGYSVLHFASIRSDGRWCLDLLVGARADINARDKDGETPLHWAATHGKEPAVRGLLAAGARKDLRPWGGLRKNMLPFAIAASQNIRDLLRL